LFMQDFIRAEGLIPRCSASGYVDFSIFIINNHSINDSAEWTENKVQDKCIEEWKKCNCKIWKQRT